MSGMFVEEAASEVSDNSSRRAANVAPAQTRHWQDVNEDVVARMRVASSDSPPVLPKRDYDDSSIEAAPTRQPQRKASRQKSTEGSDSAERRAPPDDDDDGGGGMEQLVLYGRPSPTSDSVFAVPNGEYDSFGRGPFPPRMWPPPFAPTMFGPPPPLPPMFMTPDANPYQMHMDPGILFAPHAPAGYPMPAFPPPPPPPGFFGPSPPDNRKRRRRSRSAEMLRPAAFAPPPPGMPIGPPFGPPAFQQAFVDGDAVDGCVPGEKMPDDDACMAVVPYGGGARQFAPPPPMMMMPPPPPLMYPPPPMAMNGHMQMKGKGAMNGALPRKPKPPQTDFETECYQLCCKGHTQVLCIIVTIVIIGIILGLLLGLTMV